jgi:hypothetical protein
MSPRQSEVSMALDSIHTLSFHLHGDHEMLKALKTQAADVADWLAVIERLGPVTSLIRC